MNALKGRNKLPTVGHSAAMPQFARAGRMTGMAETKRVARQCMGGPNDGETITSGFKDGDTILVPAEGPKMHFAYYKVKGAFLEFEKIGPPPTLPLGGKPVG
jgi:hypothetical protein